VGEATSSSYFKTALSDFVGGDLLAMNSPQWRGHDIDAFGIVLCSFFRSRGCGVLRQQLDNEPIWTEDEIALRSDQDVKLPTLTTNDRPLFRGVTIPTTGRCSRSLTPCANAVT
jgi:hypothetical protein